MTEQTSYNFLPVIGEESKIINSSQAPGSIYFTTDTRRIYLDWDEKGTNKLLIGGHGNLYYGTMKLENLPVDGQTTFEFNIINDIVGNNDPESNVLVPGVNDLILNSDGCFYKVTQIQDNDILIAEKLTIAGTGGNNSSGTASGAKFDTSNIFFENGKNTFSTFLDRECWIRFAARYTDEWGEIVSGEIGTYSIWVNNKEVKTGVLQGTINPEKLSTIDHLLDEEINKFDVGPHLILGTNSIQVNMLSTSGIPSNKRVTCTTSTLILKWEYAENKINHWIPGETEELKLSWELSGPADKNTYLSIDDGEFFEIGSLGSTSLNYSDYGLSHGVHKLAMKASATVGSDTLFTDTIYNNIIVAKKDNNTPILSCNFFETELQQYDTVTIPIVLYDIANTASTASISFLETEMEVGREDNVENGITVFWHYTPATEGTIVLTIQYGLIIQTLKLYVHKVDITTQEAPGYAFKFKASEFSGNDMIKRWESNTATATFSENFDWINGGLKTEKDKFNNTRSFVRVCARSNMTIDYKPFSTGFQDGKVLKIIFKTANCRTYDAQAIRCKADKLIVGISDVYDYFLLENETIEYSDEAYIDKVNNEVVLGNLKENVFKLETDDDINEFNNTYTKINDKIYMCKVFKQIENEGTPDQVIYRYAQWYETFVQESFDGLLLTAQNAIFNTLNNSISTHYCEDTYIELELDITNVDNKFSYIKFWIDGIPVSYAIYDDLDNVNRCATIPLTIGSDDCDVDIYLIKLYNKELKTEEHISNFIMDAPNSNEMINRYRRNNILDDRGEISPSLLAAANKDCLVHVYEIERMTKHKKDPIKGCTYQQYHNSLTPVLTATDVTIKVQGTSSEAYVLAAANIDSDFAVDDPEAGTFINAINNKPMPEGWSMDGGTAIPCNYFCTKVNVASAENANNALNQEWYNMFQPYQSVLKCKNPKARDTMQFTNGVLFIRDMNQKIDSTDGRDNNVFSDTLGYAPTTERPNSPYAKMYSIANMGNSKNNTHVFHDLENENECCVEVKDNQSAQERMLDFVELQDIDGGKKYFEFRYIKDGKEDMMKRKWQEFIKWMAQSNPQPAYKKHIINSSADYEVISKEPITKSNIEVFILNEENNCYDQCEGYNQNISEYYTKTDSVYGYTNLRLDRPQKYGDYTFNGYVVEDQKNPKTNEIWQKNYTPLIRGITTSQYNYLNFATKDEDGNPIVDANNKIVEDPNLGFTHDTYEYRMAKMLHECEDHLCMDSIIYHYLFIEHHCMVDNVAKNTFWSTEDGGEVWNLIKDYDNDTSDGNDNNGKLTRTYGMEPLDRLNKNAYVFNAYESVWFNFIHGLTDVCQQMYTKLAANTVKYKGKTISVWSAEDYLNMFTEWQSRIPERCWIEDYYRKYFRPNEVYNDPFFNGMIEGGQKKYQRQQFEKYQQIYMDSKYEYGTDQIFARPDGRTTTDQKMPVVTYSDCYLRLDVGSDQAKIRVKRGEPNYIYCPINNLTNATFKLLPGSIISSVGSLRSDEGQLNDYSVDAIKLGQATKLRELILGSKGRHENVQLDESLSFGANTLLETLYLCNLTKYNGPLDLSGCSNLLHLDASNSAFTSVTLADGAPIHTIELYQPTALQFSNLEKIEKFEIASYSKLDTLKLNNIDKNGLNSINIIDKAKNLGSYKLTNVIWSLNNADWLNLTYHTIKPLESLKNISPVTENKQVLSKAAALTGVLTVPQEMTASQAKTIYDKYVDSEMFANLDIIFTHDNAKLHLVTICDGDGKPFWKKRIIPGQNIDDDFLASGPQGQFNLAGLYKSPTAQYTYEFTGKWDIKNAKGELLDTLDDIAANENPSWNNIQEDVYFYPQFTTTIQEYSVRFFNGDTVIKQGVYEYGTPLKNILPNEIPYVIDNSLSLLQGYDFLGYSTVKDGNAVDLDKYVITNNTELWAVFKKVNNMRECVHEEWFDINQGVCSPKLGYNLGGKITIPATIGGEKVTSLANFVPNFLQVTHIFLQNDNTLETVKENCFYVEEKQRTYKLVYFDFEKATSLTTVEDKAFCGLRELSAYDLTNTKLTTVGQQAFNASFAVQSTEISSPNVIKLPSTITSFGTYAFAYNFYINTDSASKSSAIIAMEIGCKGNGLNTNAFSLNEQGEIINQGDKVFASYKEWNPLILRLDIESFENSADYTPYTTWLSKDVATWSKIIIQNSSGAIKSEIQTQPKKEE